MKIIIGADFVPTESNYQLFISKSITDLFGKDLSMLLASADYRIFNLETPLSDVYNPIKKFGPNLSAPCDCIHAYKAANIDLLTLANNHIMDQNVEGLDTTIRTLEKNCISYTGAGKNITEARKPFLFELDGEKIGVFACVEHEFSTAGENYPGANPYDPLESYDAVNNLCQNCGYTIVLYHGGKENYRYPTPALQKRCRKFIEKGADLVICQHSHCIGCEEKYLSGTIVYGQGNFLFDHSDQETWQTGMLVSVMNKKVSYIPLCKTKNTVRLANREESAQILDSFYARSEEIKDPGAIETKFAELAKKEYYNYVETISGKQNDFFYRVMRKLSHGKSRKIILDNCYDEKAFLKLENYLQCETHYELLLNLIKAGRHSS